MQYRAKIESLGVYLPENNHSTQGLIQGCTFKPDFDLEEITGIKNRSIVNEDEYALDLAKKAVEKCFSISSYNPQDVEMVICANICRYNGPDFKVNYEPSSAAAICKHLGMKNVIAFDISNACASMFSAVQVMNAYIQAGIIKKGLIVSGEYISHIARTAQKEINNSTDPQFASLTVGDSGAALIMEATRNKSIGFQDMELFTAAKHSELCIGRPSEQGNPGYVMYTDSSKIHATGIKLSAKHIVWMIKKWINSNQGFDHFIMHQTADKAIMRLNDKINKLAGEKLCTPENTIINLQDRGNTASTTHFVALWDQIKTGRIDSYENIVFGIQASGMNIGAAIYSLDDLPKRIREAEQEELEEAANS